jgi:hypothetical protein
MTTKTRLKLAQVLIVCIVIGSLLAVQVSAATNYFSGSTGTMNSLNGNQSAAWPISSGSVSGTNPVVTSVKLNITVSSGSSAFYIYVVSPQGTTASVLVGNKTPTLNNFNGENPSGTWQVYIITTGTVSTATARMTVNYSY